MEQTHYIGSCQHDIPAEWYKSDNSTYVIVDEPTGAYVTVTTCKECKDEAKEKGVLIEHEEIPLDDFIEFVDKFETVTNDELAEMLTAMEENKNNN